jgi:hypothetical protein
MRPCHKGMYKFESLLDGTLSIEHVALCNDYLDVMDENQTRWDISQMPPGR